MIVGALLYMSGIREFIQRSSFLLQIVIPLLSCQYRVPAGTTIQLLIWDWSVVTFLRSGCLFFANFFFSKVKKIEYCGGGKEEEFNRRNHLQVSSLHNTTSTLSKRRVLSHNYLIGLHQCPPFSWKVLRFLQTFVFQASCCTSNISVMPVSLSLNQRACLFANLAIV